jgi:hypothetical protein
MLENRVVGPTPLLTPEDVVTAVLAALREPDVPYPDAGIEVAYAFASPLHKEASGSLARFAAILHTAPYAPLLCFASAQPAPLVRDGDRAEQEVVLASPSGATAAFAFVLTRQRSGPLAGCWMTDAILRL